MLDDVPSLHGGLIHKPLRDPVKVAHRQALLKLMSQALGLTEVTGNQRKDQQGLKEVEVYLLSLATFPVAYPTAYNLTSSRNMKYIFSAPE